MNAVQKARKAQQRRAHALRYDHRKEGQREEPKRQHVVVKAHSTWARKKKTSIDLEFDGSEEYINSESHGVVELPRPSVVITQIDESHYLVEPAEHHLLSEVPKRAKCPVCGRSQKVKRDRTIGRHDVTGISSSRECAGSGVRWDR